MNSNSHYKSNKKQMKEEVKKHKYKALILLVLFLLILLTDKEIVSKQNKDFLFF